MLVGSAGARTPDHLIKSQITTVNHNKAQLIKDVISVRCVINNKLQYCTYLWSSATNLRHYRHHHFYGVPPTLLFRERVCETIPRKNIRQTIRSFLDVSRYCICISYEVLFSCHFFDNINETFGFTPPSLEPSGSRLHLAQTNWETQTVR